MLITPSILNADFLNIANEIDRVSNEADWLHLDVMDGHFVPNLSFGPAMVNAVSNYSSLPIDVHLMITHPEKWISEYVQAGADSISFHYEATSNPVEIAQELRSQNIKVGLAIKPATSFNSIKQIIEEFDLLLIMTVEPGFGGQKYIREMNPKIAEARNYIDQIESKIMIQADGGINLETIKESADSGADVFVAGSVVYKSDDPAGMIRRLKNRIKG